jgi:predicted glutamine amidotransferase
MCRLLGYCCRSEAPVASLIGDEGLREFTALSAFHCDGWGMGWYETDRPHLRRSAQRAEGEPGYRRLTHSPLSDIGLVHLRWATPGLALTRRNTHPFRYGPYLLAHNGAIHPQSRLAEMLPARWERRLHGTTDSERYLLHIMWRLEARDGDMVAAIADTVADISSRFAVNSLNAILLSPQTLYAVSWHDPARLPEAELRRRGAGATPEELAGYFHLAYRVTGDAVVAASSGWPQPGWPVLPNGSVLVVDRGTLEMSVVSLTPAAAMVDRGRLDGADEAPEASLPGKLERMTRAGQSRLPG